MRGAMHFGLLVVGFVLYRTVARQRELKALRAKEAAQNSANPPQPSLPPVRIRPVVFCGPSGVGKGSLLKLLTDEFKGCFVKSVSHTTRKPREGEKNGVHYHFTEREVMLREIGEGKFVEHAMVHGNIYGTSIKSVESACLSGMIPILELDIQGAEKVHQTTLAPHFIFISPPKFDDLKDRLLERGSETQETLRTRLETAKAELARYQQCAFFDWELQNDVLVDSYRRLRGRLFLYYPHLRHVQPANRGGTSSSNTGASGPSGASPAKAAGAVRTDGGRQT